MLCCVQILTLHAGPDAVRVFWTDKDDGQLEVADLDGSNRTTLLSGLADPRGIVVDSATDTIFWASHEPSGAIYRMDCDGTDLEILLSGLNDPADLALDRAGGVLYWAEQGGNRIRRVQLDTPLEPETLVSGLNQPYYLAIDPEAGFLYWTDFDSALIHRSTIDGDGAGAFITGQERVRDLAVAGGMLYWCDRDSNQIRRRAIDGTGTGTVLFEGAADSLDRPHGLVLDPDGGRMFWTDTRTDEINTGAMDGSGTVASLVTSGLTGAWGIDLSQQSPTPYQSWLDRFFTAEELADPGNEALLWGESSDPDLDRRTNLLEFAQGTHPRATVPDPDAMQATVIDDAGIPTFQLVFRIRNDDPDLHATVESSVSLTDGTWQTDQFTEVPPRSADPEDTAYEFVTLRAVAGTDSLPALFVRHRVTR